MMQLGGTPILVLSQDTTRESGRKVQIQNVMAAKAVSDVIRTCLGPRAMLKMLLDPMGGVVMTNDGNAILREITAQHPAAKTMIEISRTQDEEVGDGTTSVIVLAGELLQRSLPFLEQNTHPTVIICAYRQALEDAVNILNNEVSVPVDVDNNEEMLKIIMGCLRTKVVGNWGMKACEIALDAVRKVQLNVNGRTEIDIKR